MLMFKIPFLTWMCFIVLFISNLSGTQLKKKTNTNLTVFPSYTWYVPLKCTFGVLIDGSPDVTLSGNGQNLVYKTFDIDTKMSMLMEVLKIDLETLIFCFIFRPLKRLFCS